MKGNLFFVENSNGRQFAVKLLAKGDAYGANKCLTWESEKLGVEFYDVKGAGSEFFDELGQFVSRYYAETLLEGEGGLCLQGDTPAWVIERNNMLKIRAWIKTKMKEA